MEKPIELTFLLGACFISGCATPTPPTNAVRHGDGEEVIAEAGLEDGEFFNVEFGGVGRVLI